MIKLSNRLMACANFVPNGSKLCDVGTDHGYVPAYLVKQGIINYAIACDINEKPLASCASLVHDLGLENNIKCILSNGLENVNGNEIDTVLIAGMGGELIADILSRCDYIKNMHLILNPMTHAEITRKWLYSNGFEINNDIIVADGRHHYNVFDATFSGTVEKKTNIDYFLGNINDFSDTEYFNHLLNYLKNKQKSGVDYSEIIKVIEEKI